MSPIASAPELAGSSPHIILISVVLPAPFGPSKPKISPPRTDRSTASTAVKAPNRRVTRRQSGRRLPRRTDVGSGPAGTPGVLGSHFFAVARGRNDGVRLDPLHGRGRALRSA